MGGELVQGPGNVAFQGVSTDSREQSEGELFFCLLGERDGHEFALQAVQKGACAVVIDQNHLEVKDKLPVSFPLISVKDTLRALGDLAQGWRRRFSIPVVGLTGSNGKTTTKELIRSILSTKFRVMATEGNFNNLIGVPKTLFRLSPQNEIAVIEMGMNDYGEIHRLTEITEPTLGLITNVAEAHLEKLGDVQGVAKAKGELFAGLNPAATALVLVSEPAVAAIPTPAKRVPLGTPDTDLWGEVLPEGTQDPTTLKLKIHHNGRSDIIHLKLPGAHNLNNVLLALGVGRFFHIPWEDAKRALEEFSGAPSRMELVRLPDNRHLLDDCYNANPASTRAALKTLAHLKGKDRALAVLGEMKELGEYSQTGHHRVGEEVARQKIEHLVAIGEMGPLILEGAKRAGMPDQSMQYYPNVESAIEDLGSFPSEARWILIKGSRTNHLEKLVSAIKKKA